MYTTTSNLTLTVVVEYHKAALFLQVLAFNEPHIMVDTCTIHTCRYLRTFAYSAFLNSLLSYTTVY